MRVHPWHAVTGGSLADAFPGCPPHDAADRTPADSRRWAWLALTWLPIVLGVVLVLVGLREHA